MNETQNERAPSKLNFVLIIATWGPFFTLREFY
jgi:hypothetical protein